MRFNFSLCFGVLIATVSLNSLASGLISLDTLIQKPTLSSVTLNPSGSLLLTKGYPEDNLSISLIDIATSNKHTIFTAKKRNKVRLMRSFWLDDNSIYFQTVRKDNDGYYTDQKQWIVNISKKGGISSEIHAINANGYIIDPLVNQEDQLLFAIYKGKSKKRLKIFQANSDSLIRNNFKGQSEFEDLLDDALGYRTDNKHKIRFSRTYNKDDLTITHWFYNKTYGWQEIYTHSAIDEDFTPIDFIAHGKLAVLTNTDSDLIGLYEFDLASGKLGKLLYQHQKYDLVDAEIDSKTNEIKSVEYIENGKWQTEYFHEKNQQIDQLAENTFPDQQYVISSSAKNEEHFVLYVFSSNNRGDFYYYDQLKNKAHLIAPRYPEDKNYDFPNKTTLKVRSNDGHIIEAYLSQALDEVSNNVLLVMPHGGPVGIRDTDTFNAEEQYLLSRGYSVLQINYSGSEGFGKEHLARGRGQFGQTIERDISKVVEDVHQHYDFEKTCAIGASYGGYSSVMLAIKHPEIYKCVVARFGVFDLPLIFNDRNSKDDHQIKRWEQVVGSNEPEKLKQYSPVYLAEQLNTPVLITAGVGDTQASFEHSNRLKLTLTVFNKDVEDIFYKNSAHGHTDRKSRQHELAAIDEYIRRQLSLAPPRNANAKAVLKNEYKRLAEGFINNQLIGKNVAKARFYTSKRKALND